MARSKNWSAGNIVKELTKDIKGGGGGQPTFATAEGTDVVGLVTALNRVTDLLK